MVCQWYCDGKVKARIPRLTTSLVGVVVSRTRAKVRSYDRLGRGWIVNETVVGPVLAGISEGWPDKPGSLVMSELKM